MRRTLSRIPGELYVLTLLSALTRFASLFSPRAIVFDEVYFREFALHYKAGTYYFDLHPPLGKLLLAAWGAIAGVDATATGKDPAVALRILPALAGTALIVVIYLMIRKLSGSRRVATLGAGLVLLENAILVESRFILMDSMLLLFGFAAVTAALVARDRSGRSAWWWFAGAIALASLAVSIKLTGVAALGMIGLVWLIDTVRERRHWATVLRQGAMLLVIPATIYALTFAVHFALLPKSGPGDAYMPQAFQATLKGNPLYKPDASRSFPQKFLDLNRSIHSYELSLNDGGHPYSSKWTSWPIMKRGVYIYLAQDRDGKARYIYTLGNPVVWWGVLLGVILVIAGAFARPQRIKPYRWALAFLALGWAANYLPFALITRPMFLYHYFYALIFSIAFVVIGLGALTGWIHDGPKPFRFPSRLSAGGYWGILAVALLGFLYFLPITYGIPLTPKGLDARMWLDSWR